MRKLSFLLVLWCSLACGADRAEVYKWVDEDGVMHFTDRPPQDQPFDKMDVQEMYPPGEEARDDSVYRSAIEQQQSRRDLRLQQKEQVALERKAEEESEARSQANCSRAIHYFNTLKLQCPVFFDGAGILRAQCPGYYYFVEGDRTYVDDKEREELIEHYRTIVDRCKESNR